MAPQEYKILLTGATGFVGGTILTHILEAEDLRNSYVTCLLRGEQRAAELTAAYGNRVHPVIYEGLEDVDRTIEVARRHDIVIGATYGFHLDSALALVRGLALRKQETGNEVYMIHLSGTSNLTDQPVSGEYVEKESGRMFDDIEDDIYGYEKMRDALTAYDQRTVELRTIDSALEYGVNCIVMMASMIYGNGRGRFNVRSVQIPTHVNAVLKVGHCLMLADGKNEVDHGHVEDLADLYVILLSRIIRESAEGLVFGKKGIMFSGSGRTSWKGIAEGIAEAAFNAGEIDTKEVKSLSLQEAADWLCAGKTRMMEINLCSNARTTASVAHKLGWVPKHGPEAWKRGFVEEVTAAIEAPDRNQNVQLARAYEK